MKLKFHRNNFYFYSILFLGAFVASSFLKLNPAQLGSKSSFATEQRVIKCAIELPNELVQNLYYMAPDLQTAKKQLFNSKQGLFFDNALYIKTQDFNGNIHVVPFEDINCDAVGTQVSSL